MNTLKLSTFKLTGLKLPHKTSNKNGRSGIDCGALWQKFETGHIKDRIPEKLSDEVYAVYFDYAGDHTKPFSYFIGCKVAADAVTPADMDSISVPDGSYVTVLAEGKMPDCISDAWRAVWESPIGRAYKFDFEVYDARSKDWNNAAVDIYISSL